MFTTILVASDGSDTADRLIAVAQSLATRDRSKVVVAHVNELMVMRGARSQFISMRIFSSARHRGSADDPARTVPGSGRAAAQLGSS